MINPWGDASCDFDGMKHISPEFTQRYIKALRTHLDQGVTLPKTARALARQVLAAGMTTHELAILHEHVLFTEVLANMSARRKPAKIRQAAAFFAIGITPEEPSSGDIHDTPNHRKIITQLSQHVHKLADNPRTALFRVAQEALTNVERHAAAGHVKVCIREIIHNIIMTITDDGKSFDVPRTLRSRGNKHLGLLGMHERVEMVGGSFEIASSSGHGTAITVSIPPGKLLKSRG